MKAITIRGVEPEVADKLKSSAAEQGKSINQLTLEIVKEGLGLKKEKNTRVNTMIWTTCLASGTTTNSGKFIRR